MRGKYNKRDKSLGKGKNKIRLRVIVRGGCR